jgi:predicted nucleotidyltransferase
MTAQKHTVETIIEKVRELAESKREIAVIYLFGSAATNRLTAESDVDLGILFDQKPSAIELLQLQEEFTDAIGVQADVVNLDVASPILRMQVLKNGVRVFTRNETRVHAFFVRAINEYDDLKQVRKPIEDNILNGRIFSSAKSQTSNDASAAFERSPIINSYDKSSRSRRVLHFDSETLQHCIKHLRAIQQIALQFTLVNSLPRIRGFNNNPFRVRQRFRVKQMVGVHRVNPFVFCGKLVARV